MTDLECANRALVMLGVAPIGGLGDSTQAARTMSMMLPMSKTAVLSEFAWSFALTMDALVESFDAPPPGFAFTFPIPNSSVKVIQVYRGALSVDELGDRKTHLVKLNFIVQNGLICTNEPKCSVEYTYNNQELETWSAAASEALSVRLASDCASALTGGQQNGMSLLQKYQYMIASAVSSSATDEDLSNILSTHYIESRW